MWGKYIINKFLLFVLIVIVSKEVNIKVHFILIPIQFAILKYM